MKNCIFCEIADGKRERDYKIFEDRKHIAFLDLYPTTIGQSLVIPKKHIGGLNVFNLSDRDFSNLFLFAKKVAIRIKKKLKPKFIFLVVEGTAVNHLHIKLYPFYKIRKFFDKTQIKPYQPYHGYLITRFGPKAKDLIKIANRISKD